MNKKQVEHHAYNKLTNPNIKLSRLGHMMLLYRREHSLSFGDIEKQMERPVGRRCICGFENADMNIGPETTEKIMDWLCEEV